MGAMASQITSLFIVYSTVYSGGDQRKHKSSASLVFVRGIHCWPMNSPHKRPVTRRMISFDDVIMDYEYYWYNRMSRGHSAELCDVLRTLKWMVWFTFTMYMYCRRCPVGHSQWVAFIYAIPLRMFMSNFYVHYNDVIMGAIASQITSLTIVYSSVHSDADQRKHQSVTGLCAGNSPGTGEFPAQMASYAKNFSIWWRHHVIEICKPINLSGAATGKCRKK